ncbi:nuclear transport factor 2 family protein [Sphingomonas immobilis]|uniref:Nuclear transport factor 2 family protein n=1 Tax=Sphingomonas immobilis TaxID=3063997 RepID=A0ABT9A1J0_9SPHN|nr:nuclear transport factor 2 family protein [Sphingomonas sp. CA1-15]MDO7842871.1 nuclear transport factor 2 family protein [Sphingomonas sp. CA1-15]
MPITTETLLAKEEIRELRHSFAWYLETSAPDALADLFCADGVIDTGPWGRMEGQEAIRKGYGRAYRDMPQFTALHAVTNPRLIVDGDEAEGTWYLLDFSLREANVNPLLIVALYEERYRRVDGVWKYAFLKLNYLWSAEKGRITPDNPMAVPVASRAAYREAKATTAAE